MGAGVAASPHCPFAGDTKPGRRGNPRRAVSRSEPEPGARVSVLRGPSGACAPFGFPAGSPSGPKPWRFAAWQFRNRGSGFLPSHKSSAEASVRDPAGMPLAEASSLPGVHELASWVRRFAAPGPKPGPARRIRPKPFPPVAARRLASRFLPDRSLDRSPSSCLFRFGTRRFRNLGTSRSLPLSHPLKGKPAASAWRRLRQPPGLRSAASLSGGTRGPLRSGCGWEGSRPLPVDRLGHVRKLS